MERRHDLDWLRAILFAMLVPHHVAVGFVPWGEGIYGFAHRDLGPPLLELAIYFSHGWRLPALFVIAGIGTFFATGRGVGYRFIAGRMARLLVPVAVGVVTLNAVAGYAIARARGDAMSFVDFWLRWSLEPAYFHVLHLWFLVNLAVYTVLCWPLFLFRARIVALRATAPALLGVAVAATTLVIAVGMPWGKALAGDGYQGPWYLTLFAAGYLIGAQAGPVLDWARRRAFLLLAAGLALFALKVAILALRGAASPEAATALAEGGWAARGFGPAYGAVETGFAVVKGLNAWAWILAAMGLCARWLNRDGPLLRALTPATYPFYVLHFPLVLVGLALVLRTDWPWGQAFLIVTAGVYGSIAVLYLLALRLGPAIWLIGGRFPLPAQGGAA